MSRPAVLIIPGLNGHPGLLLRYADQLFPDWRPVAFNHHQDLAQDGVEGLAQRALQVLRQHHVERAIVCGESFGGTIALTLARAEPERVAALVLFSAFGWHPSGLARRGLPAMAAWSLLGHRLTTTAYRAGRLASLPSQLGVRFSRELFVRYLLRPRADVVAYRTKVELSLGFDARPWLPQVTCPAFVLTGSWDPVVPAAAGRELARLLPHAHLYRLPGGHLVHLVHAPVVGSLIHDWARAVAV